MTHHNTSTSNITTMSNSNTKRLLYMSNNCSAVAETADRLATIDMDQKLEGAVAL